MNKSDAGWVRLQRSLLNSELWLEEKFTRGQAWADLFANACHAPSRFWVRGNEVRLERGQIGWSELTFAKRWRWSRCRVRRFLKWLETEQQIIQQKTFITSIITIVNYDKHQADDSETRQQTRQQKDSRPDSRRYTYKNDKNVKKSTNTKEIGEPKRFIKPTPAEVDQYAQSIGFNLKGQYFCDYNEARGWMIGKNHMKDWKATVRTWHNNEKRRGGQGGEGKQDNAVSDAQKRREERIDASTERVL